MKKSMLLMGLKRIAVLLAIVLFLGVCGCSSSSSTPTIPHRPVIFVHGYAGSADQFETQAMRFATNGYPANYISGYEYNTLSVTGNPTAGFVVPDDVLSGLDAYIDSVLKQTGADKVDLLGHSMGTAVCHAYLADATHAAKVAHYVNLDGQQSTTPPGGVPTLAIFAELTGTGREIGGATNITLANTTHVQAASCVESFTAMYKFFNNDVSPVTTDIRGLSSNIELAGRVVTFLTNVVPDNLKLDVYEVNKDTGVRIRSTPDYSTLVNTDGKFNFTTAKARSNYEFHLTSTADTTTSIHYYYETFVKSDYMIRLKFIAPASMNLIMDKSDNHSNLIVIRDKEFLGVNSMYPNEDSLKVNGTEVCAGVLTKSGTLGTPIALFIFDKGSDGISDLSGPITSGIVANLSFISGLDFYMRAANPPDSTIPIVLNGRYSGKTQTVHVPNWPSSADIITVQMWDY